MIQEEADAALVARYQKGDAEGFARLVGRYERPVYNLAFRMLGDREEARDVAQTAFLKALENLHRYDPKFRFFSWLYRIAMNEALDQLDRRGRHTELTDVHVANDDLLRDAAAADTGSRVRIELDHLSAEHRAVLVLRHFQELSYEQIGEVLDVSEITVKSRLYEAREKLRVRLADAGLEP